MARRTTSQAVAANVADAILTSGTDNGAFAQAAGLTIDELESRLHGDEDFTLYELGQISGLSCVPTSHLLREVA